MFISSCLVSTIKTVTSSNLCDFISCLACLEKNDPFLNLKRKIPSLSVMISFYSHHDIFKATNFKSCMITIVMMYLKSASSKSFIFFPNSVSVKRVHMNEEREYFYTFDFFFFLFSYIIVCNFFIFIFLYVSVIIVLNNLTEVPVEYALPPFEPAKEIKVCFLAFT